MAETPGLRVRIERLAFRGHGLGRVESADVTAVASRLLRVPKALPGELVDVAPPQERQRHLRLRRVLEASPLRRKPGCPQDLRCPGCQLRALPYEAQLDHKLEGWARLLERLLAEAPRTEVPRRAIAEGGYRVRAVVRPLPVEGSQDIVWGMKGIGGAAPIDLTACPAQHPALCAHLARSTTVIARHVADSGLSVVEGVRFVTAELAQETGAARLIIDGIEESRSALIAAARDLGSASDVACVVVITGIPHAPPGRGRAEVIAGDGSLRLKHGSHWLRAPYDAWVSRTPTNAAVVEDVLLDLVARALSPASHGTLVELGCGIGVHTIGLLSLATHYVGVDASRSAIEAAKVNVGEAHASTTVPIELRVGRAGRAVRRLVAKGVVADVAIVHGMRRPFGQQLCNVLPALGARTIIYVASTAYALAHDAGLLEGRGYRTCSVTPVDTMPHTYHMMAVALLTRTRAPSSPP